MAASTTSTTEHKLTNKELEILTNEWKNYESYGFDLDTVTADVTKKYPEWVDQSRTEGPLEEADFRTFIKVYFQGLVDDGQKNIPRNLGRNNAGGDGKDPLMEKLWKEQKGY